MPHSTLTLGVKHHTIRPWSCCAALLLPSLQGCRQSCTGTQSCSLQETPPAGLGCIDGTCTATQAAHTPQVSPQPGRVSNTNPGTRSLRASLLWEIQQQAPAGGKRRWHPAQTSQPSFCQFSESGFSLFPFNVKFLFAHRVLKKNGWTQKINNPKTQAQYWGTMKHFSCPNIILFSLQQVTRSLKEYKPSTLHCHWSKLKGAESRAAPFKGEITVSVVSSVTQGKAAHCMKRSRTTFFSLFFPLVCNAIQLLHSWTRSCLPGRYPGLRWSIWARINFPLVLVSCSTG